jgi:hypothetical protein
MAALTTKALRKGHKAMEKAITKAARVRRQLSAGRPRTTRSLSLNVYGVVGRLVGEAERARGMMREAGLDPNDVHLGLIIRTSTDLQCKWLPGPEKAEPYFEEIAEMPGAKFLGILWKQTDHEVQSNGVPLSSYWVTPFVAEPEAQEQMLALKSFVATGGARMHTN